MAISIRMPALSPTMEEGTLAKWRVKAGDHVSPGDVIAEIETDKATMDVEAVDEGVVARLLVPEGTENIKVRTPIAELAGDDDARRAPNPLPEARLAPQEGAQRALAPQHRQVGGARVWATPLARRLAGERGIDLRALTGSGPHGRIVKADLEGARGAPAQAPSTPCAPPAPIEAPAQGGPQNLVGQAAPLAVVKPVQLAMPYKAGEYTLAPLDTMRKAIARRMTQSFQDVPHFSLNADVELDRFLEARKQLNARLEHENIKLSVNDILIRACALALMKSPNANVSYVEGALLRHAHAHVAVAVAVPGGLVTPVVFYAETKGLAQISKEIAALAEKARARKLLPADYEGGTFTISNLGMYGIESFTSIINEPQSMILSVGAGAPKPIVKNGAIAIATMMSLTLTCDHRAVDGAIGAEFLAALRGFVEDPMSMML